MRVLGILILFGQLYAFGDGAPQEKFRCPLEWKDISQVPKTEIVNSHPGSVQIARTSVDDFFYIGKKKYTQTLCELIERAIFVLNYPGWADCSTSEARFVEDGAPTVVTSSFFVLTNPHGCKIAWYSNNHRNVSSPLSEFISPADPGNNPQGFVGRFETKSNVLLPGKFSSLHETFDKNRKIVKCSFLPFPGHIAPDLSHILVATEEGKVENQTKFQVLISYSTSFQMEIVNLEFNPDPYQSGQLSLMGMDEIHNDFNGNVTQTVTLTIKSKESYSFSTNSFEKSGWGVSVGVKLKKKAASIGATIGYSQNNENSMQESFSKETEKVSLHSLA